MDKLDKKTDGSSMDIVQENIAKLKQLFPDVFSEGKIDFEKLQEALGEYTEDKEERYNFTWHGKAQAKRIAQTVSTGTLLPCKEESKNWDTTQNLFIEGDNLEVLKLLQKSYHNQVKMIYIDPPYNTGKEFIYPDNYRDNLDTYLEYTGQKDNEGRKFGTNPEQSGKYHTNWLNMMYPRLKLARNLLKDDGVIFISIDDNEVTNLRKLCDEIFGEENFKADVSWQKRYTRSNNTIDFTTVIEHIIIYAKSDSFIVNLLPRTNEADARYTNPNTGKITNPTTNSWRRSPEEFERLQNDGRLYWGIEGTQPVPSIKMFLTEARGITPINFWDHKYAGNTDQGTQHLEELLGKKIFNNPKPVTLIKRVLEHSLQSSDLVLDFFSGSCTTAHAVMDLNAQDGGNRKHIMVQLPEPCDEKSEAYKAGYKTIADIGKERIRCAGEKILEDNADKEGIADLDIGFKVFKLDSSNIKPWDADFDNLEDTLLSHVDNIKPDRSEEDVLYEILLKYGLNLTVPIEERSIHDKTVYSIGFGALIVCLDDEITLDVVDGIGALKEELEPEVMRVVFKDSGFNDVLKTNAIQNLKRFGIDDVKSL